MIFEDTPELDNLDLFLSDTVLSDDDKIKGSVSVYLKSLTHSDKECVLQMRNQNIYWNEKVNEYLRSNITEDKEEVNFLFDKRDDIVFVISCLEAMHPQFNLRDKPLPPFVLVEKGEVEQLFAQISDINNHRMLVLKKVVNLEESSMYWYAPKKPEMDPYAYMDNEFVVGNHPAYCFFVNPLKNRLVALEYAFFSNYGRIMEEEEEDMS